MGSRILVIDDDPVNLDLMTYLLTAFGHTPLPAEGAAAALEQVRLADVDLILCDIQMPGVDGFEFLRRLTAERRRNVPVIGVTALAMVGDREKILAAGFDGYMAKPITPETFVQDIEQFLTLTARGQAGPPRSTVQLEDSAPAVPAKQRNAFRVLIVDNEAANLELLRLLLQFEGYEVVTASSGNAAIQVARRVWPHAIVSDVHMPDGGGFDLIESMRRDARLRDTPIILVSATTQGNKDVEKALRLGASKFLLRPFEPEALLDTLTDCLAKAGGPA